MKGVRMRELQTWLRFRNPSSVWDTVAKLVDGAARRTEVRERALRSRLEMT